MQMRSLQLQDMILKYCPKIAHENDTQQDFTILQNGQALYDKIIAVAEADESKIDKENQEMKKAKTKYSYSGKVIS